MICRVCGKEYRWDDHQMTFCSPQCQRIFNQQRYTPVDYENRVCVMCGTIFKPRTKKSEVCSKRCSDKRAYSKIFIKNSGGKNVYPIGYFKKMKPRPCSNCKKPFIPTVKGRYRHCSDECEQNARHRFRREHTTNIDDLFVLEIVFEDGFRITW